MAILRHIHAIDNWHLWPSIQSPLRVSGSYSAFGTIRRGVELEPADDVAALLAEPTDFGPTSLSVREVKSMVNDVRNCPYATPQERRAVLQWVASHVQIKMGAAMAV